MKLKRRISGYQGLPSVENQAKREQGRYLQGNERHGPNQRNRLKQLRLLLYDDEEEPWRVEQVEEMAKAFGTVRLMSNEDVESFKSYFSKMPWVVKNQIGKKELVVDYGGSKLSVYLFGCKVFVLQIQGKDNKITRDWHMKTVIVFKNVMTAQGKDPTFSTGKDVYDNIFDRINFLQQGYDDGSGSESGCRNCDHLLYNFGGDNLAGGFGFGDANIVELLKEAGQAAADSHKNCAAIEVTPCLLAPSVDSLCEESSDKKDSDVSSRAVWSLPYSLVLSYTTEEVLAACIKEIEPSRAAFTSHLRSQVMNDFIEGLKEHDWFTGFDIGDEPPMRFSLEEWVKLVKEVQGTVFIAVHGGIGEKGTLQSLLEAEGVPCTGPRVTTSRTCMDKVVTSLALNHLADRGVLTIEKDVRRKEVFEIVLISLDYGIGSKFDNSLKGNQPLLSSATTFQQLRGSMEWFGDYLGLASQQEQLFYELGFVEATIVEVVVDVFLADGCGFVWIVCVLSDFRRWYERSFVQSSFSWLPP